MANAVRVMEVLAEDSRQDLDIPHATTGRMWLLRLGYFKLHRPKERADDWVWIIDHTTQIGKEKCLMIVGFRLSQWTDGVRPLKLQDLEPMAILPVTHSDKDIVYYDSAMCFQDGWPSLLPGVLGCCRTLGSVLGGTC
jgi:hypothetical protein